MMYKSVPLLYLVFLLAGCASVTSEDNYLSGDTQEKWYVVRETQFRALADMMKADKDLFQVRHKYAYDRGVFSGRITPERQREYNDFMEAVRIRLISRVVNKDIILFPAVADRTAKGPLYKCIAFCEDLPTNIVHDIDLHFRDDPTASVAAQKIDEKWFIIWFLATSMHEDTHPTKE